MFKLASIITLSFLCTVILNAQSTSLNEGPFVKLEYVVDQYASTTALGSFVLKNNYPTRNLNEHLLQWDLSFNGNVIYAGAYPLMGIEPGDTKYINLRKLFDLHLLDELGNGLISLYAEVQDTAKERAPIRIVGESVVLAEAEKKQERAQERYQVINVAGARIHRIANGNSLTLDVYNQFVGLDLGNGNVLAGPIRPILTYDTLSGKLGAQHLIDSLGPTRFEMDEAMLVGEIEYDLDTFGLLRLPFQFNENGLTVSIRLENANALPNQLALEIPMRESTDSVRYLGQSPLSALSSRWGDTRLGWHTLALDPAKTSSTMLGTRSILLERATVLGDSYTFQIEPVSNDPLNSATISVHPMPTGAKKLLLEREFESFSDGAYTSRKVIAISSGEWLFAQKVKSE